MNAMIKLTKVGAKVTPPKPTKKQLLQATAMAMVEEAQKKRKEIEKVMAELYTELLTSCSKNKTEEIEYRITSNNINGKYKHGCFCTEYSSLNSEQQKIHDQYKVMERNYQDLQARINYQFVLQELTVAASRSADEVVTKLLEDEVIKAQLLKAGQKLLTEPSLEDKVNSLTV